MPCAATVPVMSAVSLKSSTRPATVPVALNCPPRCGSAAARSFTASDHVPSTRPAATCPLAPNEAARPENRRLDRVTSLPRTVAARLIRPLSPTSALACGWPPVTPMVPSALTVVASPSVAACRFRASWPCSGTWPMAAKGVRSASSSVASARRSAPVRARPSSVNSLWCKLTFTGRSGSSSLTSASIVSGSAASRSASGPGTRRPASSPFSRTWPALPAMSAEILLTLAPPAVRLSISSRPVASGRLNGP